MINNLYEYKKAIEMLNEWTVAYEQNYPIVSDKGWDDLYFEVQQYEVKNNVQDDDSPTKHVGYIVMSKLEKVQHDHPMLSLDKTKDVSVVKDFLGDKDNIIMAKMDGLTCSLTYTNGILTRAETRGNGTEGEDITHNAHVIPSIPKKLKDKASLIIDGEIICTYEDFKFVEDKYQNPRNYAAGSIRLLNNEECKQRNLTFIAWDLIKSEKEYISLFDKLYDLENVYNFKVVPYLVNISTADNSTIEAAIGQVKEMATACSYPIDGIVFKYNICSYYESLGYTSHHFRGGLAFKFYDEEYQSKLLDVEWQLGRTGVLTPVAIFEDINFEDSIVNRASVHNLSVLNSLTDGYELKGDTVSVIKSNQIIPQITNWVHNESMTTSNRISMPKFCPVCKQTLTIEKSESGVLNLCCSNPECLGKFHQRLIHYCSDKGMNIKGLSEKNLNKFIDWGWIEELSDIYKLKDHLKEWVKKPGFGDKSITNILNSIEVSKATELWRIIAAAGISGVGTSTAKDLASHFKTWDAFMNAAAAEDYDFSLLDNFGDVANENLHNFDYSVIDFIVKNYLKFPVIDEYQTVSSDLLKGQVFVITGKTVVYKNRNAIKEVIESYGGKVSSAVSKRTTYLINNDTTSNSVKNNTAKKLGVNIISEEDFNKLIEKI